MAINLQKGQRVSVGLERVGIGLGWDPNDSSGHDFDLDASVFLLNDKSKLLSDRHLVFYNNLASPDGAVKSSGDDTTGGNSDGDDETLAIDFTKLDPLVAEIFITVTIHDYERRRQNFGQVRNSFVRIYDLSTNDELCKYELDEDFSVETAIEFGRLYKRGDEWKFEAVGKGYPGGLQYFVSKFL